jgi:pimeloyl-ACP methyl ester carboxylesterase
VKKTTLVLVHSFPTNSILLKGLKDFLGDYFTVHFVDLPGFDKGIPPLKKITLEGYSDFVRDTVDRLRLKGYWLGGVSFGFFVVNNCKIDHRCKGFFAIEPFIGMRFLKVRVTKKLLLKSFIGLISKMHMHAAAYRSRFLMRTLLRGYSESRIETTTKTIDGRAFFETARLILSSNSIPKFHPRPYILVINDDDSAVDSAKVLEEFGKLNKVLVVKTTSEHYPQHPTKGYFKKHIKPSEIRKIVKFCAQ